MKNILQITAFPEGGIGLHLILLLKGLHKQHNISFVTNFDKQDDRFKNEFITLQQSLMDITHLEIKKKPSIRSDLFNIFKLYKIYKNKNIHIVHGHGAKGGLYARVLGFMLNTKVIYTPHGGSLHDMHGKFMGSIYIFIEKILYYFTDKFIFESQYSKNIFTKKVNSCEEKLYVNYNGIKINNENKVKAFDKTKINISAFGLLRHLKGHDILIKAVKILIDKGYSIKLTIYGDGEEKNNLKNLIHKLRLETDVTLFGFVEDTKYYMLKSDIIVQPSRFEALPYVPIEAMNLNIPVVVSNVGGLTEIVSNQNNGLVFESDCVDALVKKLEQLITDDELRNKLMKNAKKTVINHFNEEITLKNLNEIYQMI